MKSLCLLLVLTVCGAASAQPAAPPPALGIAMEEFPYPWPVHFLPLSQEGQMLRMAYMDVAPAAAANGRTVVLLHGKNFWGSYWQGTAQVLSQHGFRVVIPDQIGFGKSSKPEINYSFDLLAANTNQLLDSLGVTRAVVVGHSMGGMLAVRYARNYPQRTERLVLEDPIGLEDYRFAIPPRSIEQLTEDEMKQTPEAYLDYIRHYFVTWKREYQIFATVRERMTASAEFPRWAKVSALTYQMIYQQPVRHEFALIELPTLLVIGLSDRTVVGRAYAPPAALATLGQYPQLGRAAAHDIPHCQLVEIPNVGHIPHLEAPDAFHAALLAFVQ